jgi:hypothetical protein
MLVGIVACICFLTHPVGPNTQTNAAGGEPTAKRPSAPDWLRGRFNPLQPAWFNLLQPAWGLHGGLVYAILPGISKGTTGEPSNNTATPPAARSATVPRGLIRLFSPVLDGGRYDLVNFIAVEPVVGGKRGLSELELSRLDGVPGKRIWALGPVSPQMPGEAGRLTKLKSGVEELEVVLRVERFDNGAHVYLVATQFSNAPDEIRFTVHREPDSAP